MPKLASKMKCTGCTACAAVCPKNCIEMQEGEDGFLYPFVYTDRCINCGCCTRVCPICFEKSIHRQNTTVYAAYSTNNELRRESSSGGIFSEIACIFLNNGGVVYGASYNDQFEVVHICVEKESDLYKLRGAKYAQSSLKDIFVQVRKKLNDGERVLFSGTPCQIIGLRSFLGKEYKKLVCVDFVCHGVPSPAVWKSYVQYRSNKDNDGELPLSINMRSKMTGWSYYKYSNEFKYKKYIFSQPNGENLFMKLFVGDYINRLSCTYCPAKGYNRVSDLTLGDFWGIWDISPDMDDNKGTSLVLIHSDKGESIFNAIGANIVSKQMSLEQASKMNPSLLISACEKKNRENYLYAGISGDFDEMQFPDSAKLNCLRFLLGKLKRLISKFNRK